MEKLNDDELSRQAGREDVQREVIALCDDTEQRYGAVAKSDLEGQMGAFARGRIKEAKSIRDAICEVVRFNKASEPHKALLRSAQE